jgi:orotidine-5'-phosphate decarboxylase
LFQSCNTAAWASVKTQEFAAFRALKALSSGLKENAKLKVMAVSSNNEMNGSARKSRQG